MAIIVVSVLVLLVPERTSSCRPNARHSSRRQSARRLHPLRASLAFQYTAAAVVWGASFLFMKIGLEGLSFTQVVLWRLVFGALALVSRVSGQPDRPTEGISCLEAPGFSRSDAMYRSVAAVQLGRAKHVLGTREHLQRHHATDDYGCLPCLSAGGDADAIQVAGVASRIAVGC